MKETPKIESANHFPVVGIGASAGGLDAFKKFLRAIPEDSGMAYVLVQHLDPNHESILPELLQKVTSIPVLEISDEIKVKPNHIYVIPSNKMIVANDGVLELTPRPENTKHNLNLPVDLFFTSLAEVHQYHAIGVVLSGTASDGTAGLKAIKDHGGITFAQDEISAAYTGMPNSAIQAGVVDFVLSPEEMPAKILQVVQKLGKVREDNQKVEDDGIFKKIISLLRIRKGTDFTFYKQTTIRRRILRRMALNKNDEPADYLGYLKDNKSEQDILYQDMLIPVTSFFRDGASFEQLCETIFPQLLKNKLPGEPVRVWVAGCSTGEEAYSVAICLSEFLGENHEKVQIFATDLSEPAIAKARAGIYSKSDTDSIAPTRLKEFFTKTGAGYVVKKEIRDMCVFAVHNFLKDPAFGKIDLICCRNVLIYMDTYLQKKALTAFHYSLNLKGFLFLGKTETTSCVPELFASAGKNSKLYVRKNVAGRFMHVASLRIEQSLSYTDPNFKPEMVRNDFEKAADEIVMRKYTPSGVVVNESLDIVYFRGNTGDYLEQSSGKPSHNVLKMARHGLAFELRNILHKAKKEQAAVIKENISIQLNGDVCYISLEAIPLHTIDSHYLILFHSHNLSGSKIVGHIQPGRSQDEKDFRIVQLEQELSRIHNDMRSITEDQEAINEELQSDNEELLSTTEELQSLNEELETSKEELQSTNEELTVVNQEIVDLNEQVTESKNYAEAIVGTIREPFLILDKDLRVKTVNSSYFKSFQVNESDTQGKLIYEMDNKQWNTPVLRKLLENILPEKSTFRDLEIVHTFSNIGERILLLNAREIRKEEDSEKLILLAFEDITEQRNAEEIQSQIQKRFQFIADAMPQKVWTADAEGNMDYFNKTWLDYSGLPFDALKNWGWGTIIHPEDFEKNNQQWRRSIDTGNDFELEERFLNKDGEYKWHLSRGLSYKDESGKILMWVGTNTEIQEHMLHKEELEKSVVNRTFELSHANELLECTNAELEKMNSELHSFTYVSSHDLQEPLRKIQTFANHMIEREKNNLSESGKDYLNRIESAAERMQRLIKDLLAFSRINTADRKFEKTSLNLIMDEVKEELAEVIAEKKAVIKDKHLGTANIIPFQFRQLMYNLVSNALKFSRPDAVPHIIISCKTEKHSASKNPLLQKLIIGKDYCHIVVADDGIGFEPQFSERIFEVFQKLHPKEEYAGTGIGLAIVKRIVNNHNGFITATSELGKGVTFDIYIPVD